ncbi:sensor histidine kinase [Nocardia sp. NPDC057440]|uniref:sensor histidine kinase n=1 Tax=Nocardia sp. NPDC057440 TaxID=3346134 RepID=UPI00366C2437
MMDVTRAMISPAGGGPAIPFRETGTVWSRTVAFARHPIAVARQNIEELPFDYPPSLIVSADVALFLVGVAATAQRHSYFPTAVPVLAMLLMFIASPLFCIFGVRPWPWIVACSGMAATALFLIQPVSGDFAPFVLIVCVGEVAAIAPKRASVLFGAVAIAELLAFDMAGNLQWTATGERLEGLPMYILGIALGWLVGVMMQHQRRFLYQEREFQDIRAARAADEERRRIAREVHDVIAHSLSITLLHLTAARHALQTDRDVDDAVEALVDAERLGRQAMADIRRTIGLLDVAPSKQAPEPGVEDIEDLVGDFVRAGLDVRYTGAADLGPVSAAVGLALYRIGQESLANVVKHAPGASTTVELAVDAAAVTLVVNNTLPGGVPPNRGHGMGLSGMAQRAELLGGRITAGPFDDGWSVRAQFPLAGRSGPWCSLLGQTSAREGA